MKRPLLFLMTLALLLRVAIVLAGIGYDKTLSFFDARDYETHAQNLLAGKGFTNGAALASRPPLYPVLLATLYRLFGISRVPVRLFQSVLDVLTLFLIYQIGRRSVEKRALWIGLSLCAVHPILILYCGNILTETTSCFLLALLTWQAIRASEKESPFQFLLAGFACGLLLLTKASLIFFLPFLIGWIFFREKPLSSLAAFCLALTLALTPWTLRNYRLLGSFIPLTTNGGNTYWMANNPQAAFDPEYQGLAIDWVMPGKVTIERDGEIVLLSEVEGNRYLWRKGWRFVKSLLLEQPRLFAWVHLKKLLAAFSLHAGKSFLELLGYGALYTLSFLGLFLTLRRRPRPVLLYLLVLHYVVATLIFWGRAKYRVVVEPYLMLFAGVALSRIAGKLKWTPPE